MVFLDHKSNIIYANDVIYASHWRLVKMEGNKQGHCIIHSSSCDENEKLVFLKDASSRQSLPTSFRQEHY